MTHLACWGQRASGLRAISWASGLGAPGWFPHTAGMLALGARPGPRPGSIGPSPHGLHPPTGDFGFFSAWAGFQEQASQETGSGSCQRLKAGTQILAQHLVYSVHLSDSHKASLREGETSPLKGKLDQKIWRFETTTGAQTRSFLGGGGCPSGQAVSSIMALMQDG